MMEKKKNHYLAGALLGTIGAVAATKLAWILYSRRYIDHHAKLNIIIDAEQHTYHSPTAGDINFYQKGSGNQTPILLVHGLHMFAGLFDILPIFESFGIVRPVYAIDLPGFGRSEKTDRPYRPSMYQEAIADFIKNQIGKPCHVLTLGNASEFAASAALTDPNWIKSLVMINPTGFAMPQPEILASSSRKNWEDFLLSVLRVPIWSLPLYDLISSRTEVADYYRGRFAYNVPTDLVELAYTSAHQAGAHFAPMVFASGKLSIPEIRQKVYEKITQPVLVIYDNEVGKSFDMLPQMVREHANWKAWRSRNTKGMPHFEKSGELFREFDLFWKKQDKKK